MNWLDNVKVSNTIDMAKPIDTRFEMAMLSAHKRGFDKGYKQAEEDMEANTIDVPFQEVLDEYMASDEGGEAL